MLSLSDVQTEDGGLAAERVEIKFDDEITDNVLTVKITPEDATHLKERLIKLGY